MMDTTGCRARAWRLQVVGEGALDGDTLLEASLGHDDLRYFARTGPCLWLAFGNPVSKASVLALFERKALHVSVVCSGGPAADVDVEQEWGTRPRSFPPVCKKEAEGHVQPAAARPLVFGRHLTMMKNSPARQALLKALKKFPGGAAAEAGAGWVDQVDADAAKLQEDARVLVESVYATMLKVASQPAGGEGGTASAQAEALRETQKMQGEMEFMRARHTLQEACIARQRKQINLLRLGLANMCENKENDCEGILQQARALLLETPAAAGARITNRDAIQDLPKCLREQEVCEQVLSCITSLHAEVKKLKKKDGGGAATAKRQKTAKA